MLRECRGTSALLICSDKSHSKPLTAVNLLTLMISAFWVFSKKKVILSIK